MLMSATEMIYANTVVLTIKAPFRADAEMATYLVQIWVAVKVEYVMYSILHLPTAI